MALFVSVQLDAALHISEGALHPLGEALLDLPVVLLHLQGRSEAGLCFRTFVFSGSSKFQYQVTKTWLSPPSALSGFLLLTPKAPENLLSPLQGLKNVHFQVLVTVEMIRISPQM